MIARFLICIGMISFISANSFAQDKDIPVEAIIEKHIAARGGMDNIKQLQSIRLSGLHIFRGQEFPLMIQRQRPNMFRLETSSGYGPEMYLFDGETAHAIDAKSGDKKAIRDPRIRHFVEMMADFDGALVDYKSKGHQIALAGTESIEGQPAYVLDVALQNGPKEQWFLDAQSFLPVKRSSTFMDEDGQQTQSLYFMDYAPVEGYMIPHYFERNAGHYVYGYEIERVEINPDDTNQ